MIRIKHERLRRKWNQVELAYHSGLSTGEISKFERGWAKPFPGQAKRLARVLSIKPDQLLENVPDDNSDGIRR